jgi:hypothetical protein
MNLITKNLEGIRKHYINNDNDYCMIVDGKEGTGKSTEGIKYCRTVDKDFRVEQVAFSASEFLTKLQESKVKKALLWDEAEAGAFSRDSVGSINKLVVKALMVSRAKKIFLVMVIPSFFLIDKYLRMHRVGMLVHLPRRGSIECFSSNQIKRLTVNGDKYWDYKSAAPSFTEHCAPIPKSDKFWQAYMVRKRAFMKDYLSQTLKKLEVGSRFQSALFNLYLKTPLTQKEIADIVEISIEPVNRYITAERQARGISELELQRLKAENK